MGILVRSKAEGSAQITCAKPERKINVSMCLKKYFIACRLLPPQFWITRKLSFPKRRQFSILEKSLLGDPSRSGLDVGRPPAPEISRAASICAFSPDPPQQ